MASEFLTIAQRVLERQSRPLSAKEIVTIAYEEGLISDRIAGKTPHQTLKSKLSVDIRTKGNSSIFVRTAPGRFFLRSLLDSSRPVYDAPPLVPPKPKEQVLVVPSEWLDRVGRFQGISAVSSKIVKPIFEGAVTGYLDRMDAEINDSHKQILTYVMVTRGEQVLSFRRGTYNRVEAFLRGSFCIGFGGHVTSNDRDLFDGSRMGIYRCAARELAEELSLPEKDLQRLERMEGLQLRGILNDDSSPVGRRHMAFVFQYRVSDTEAWNTPQRGEKSITNLQWLTPGQQRVKISEFEYWSQLCIQAYLPFLGEGQANYLLRRKRFLRPPHLLCVVGEIGSGKTQATNVLCERHGYVEVNSGRALASIMGIPPIPESQREFFQQHAWEFIRGHDGPRRLAIELYRQAMETGAERIIVDGIRQMETLEELRNLATPLRVGMLFVHTPPHIAFEFYGDRDSPAAGHSSDIHSFFRLRDDPVEQEVRTMIGNADAVLYNWNGIDEYHQTVRRLMEEVQG